LTTAARPSSADSRFLLEEFDILKEMEKSHARCIARVPIQSFNLKIRNQGIKKNIIKIK
jgi:hypothetical protein